MFTVMKYLILPSSPAVSLTEDALWSGCSSYHAVVLIDFKRQHHGHWQKVAMKNLHESTMFSGRNHPVMALLVHFAILLIPSMAHFYTLRCALWHHFWRRETSRNGNLDTSPFQAGGSDFKPKVGRDRANIPVDAAANTRLVDLEFASSTTKSGIT
eukprot:s1026_g8.t1